MTVELQEAGMKLAELAKSAATGEDVILVLEGKPVARLARLEPEPPKRKLGGMEHMGFHVPDDFDTMCEGEIEQMFYREG